MGKYGGFRYNEDVYGPDVGIYQLIPGYLSLRVVFMIPMKNDAELVNADNYLIEAFDAAPTTQIHHSSVLSVAAEADVEFPTYVDLVCTDLTDGKDYRLTISPDKITTWEDDLILAAMGGLSGTYVGVSEFPRVQTITPLSATLMEVVFSKEMSIASTVSNPAFYSFDKGLTVRDVIVISPGVVNLLTTKQTPLELYTLTLTLS